MTSEIRLPYGPHGNYSLRARVYLRKKLLREFSFGSYTPDFFKYKGGS